MTPRWILPLVVVADLAVITVLSLLMGWPAVFFAVPLVAASVIALVVLTITTRARQAVSRLPIPAGPYRVAEPTPHAWSSGTDAYPDWTGRATSSDGSPSTPEACAPSDSWSSDGASCSSDSGSSSSDSGSSSSDSGSSSSSDSGSSSSSD